ncbi:SDH family Clp fold serine proteinase [Pseudodesulfovibrio sp.]|uniref:SDH family Clp fold serine proteinase n=1 Tax=unclassified Pseudodesulfovibrio TaxID=2661612 RepID=UPI003B002CE4
MSKKKRKPRIKLSRQALSSGETKMQAWGQTFQNQLEEQKGTSMGYVTEYIAKLRDIGVQGIEAELQELIKKFNGDYKGHLIIYSAAMDKVGLIPDVSMTRSDFEVIYDMIRNLHGERCFVYLETPGGRGDTAMEIAELLHKKFEEVNFVITGEAKSAGTILALSGHRIFMTETGALGPIDAQVKTGRAFGSAHGYLEWVEETREKALKEGRLDSFEATMVAQISPTELKHVYNAFEFAKELVVSWLPQYKFKNWDVTESKKEPVTEDKKIQRANEIARDLTDINRWRDHGRSLKLKEMEEIKLTIDRVDDDPNMADLVYRMQSCLRMLYGSSNNYKSFVTSADKVFKSAGIAPAMVPQIKDDQLRSANIVEVEILCDKCRKTHRHYLKFSEDKAGEAQAHARGAVPFPKNGKLTCGCGATIDISGFRNQVESAKGKKAID